MKNIDFSKENLSFLYDNLRQSDKKEHIFYLMIKIDPLQ